MKINRIETNVEQPRIHYECKPCGTWLYDTIKDILAHNPGIKRRDSVLRLVVYPINGTPFFILYDYDDSELRVHFVFINGKPLREIDPKSVEW